MLKEKAGVLAGEIWNTLNENGALDIKAIKKLTKETEKNLYLGLGWLLREDKITCEDNVFNLK